MSVVDVRVVRMRMRQPVMPVWVRVRLSRWITGSVRMLVVLIVYVRVAVLEFLVLVPMPVPLAQVKPKAQRHDCRRR